MHAQMKAYTKTTTTVQ